MIVMMMSQCANLWALALEWDLVLVLAWDLDPARVLAWDLVRARVLAWDLDRVRAWLPVPVPWLPM